MKHTLTHNGSICDCNAANVPIHLAIHNTPPAKSVLTVHPLPHARRESWLFLGANPHQLRAQFALASLQLGQYEIVGGPLEVVYEIAAVRLAHLARLVEGLAPRDVELVAGARER